MSYDETLSATTADSAQFVVQVDGTGATIDNVTINGSTVELTLASAITPGQNVTVIYTDPTTSDDSHAIQDSAGNDAASMEASVSFAATNLIIGTTGADTINGMSGSDSIHGLGGDDVLSGGACADQFVFGLEAFDGARDRDTILDFEAGLDAIVLADGVTLNALHIDRPGNDRAVLYLNGDHDTITVIGAGLTPDSLNILTDDGLSYWG